MKKLRYLPNVSTLVIDAEACVGCAICTLVCPHAVPQLIDQKARIADRDGCMECGACANNCPTHAIRVTPGVGCAAYIIQTWVTGKDAAACGGPGCC